VAGFDDEVTLTQREREVLASLASSLDDKWLSYQLTGTEIVLRRSSRITVELPRWTGPLLLVFGALLTFVTFAEWLWAVGGAGFGLIALGGWLVWQDRDSARHDRHCDHFHPAVP
jgi:hypothetical protein